MMIMIMMMMMMTWSVGVLNDVAVLPASRLIAGEAEGHDCQDEDDEDGDDGEDVCPAHLAASDVVVADAISADAANVHVVPAGREDHTAEEHQNT